MASTHLARQYATALLHADERMDTALLTKNLVARLRAKGRMKLLPGIVRALNEAETRARARAPHVEVARAADRDAALAAARAAGLPAEDAAINDALIRGWRVRSASSLVDQSAKHSLVELYRNITK